MGTKYECPVDLITKIPVTQELPQHFVSAFIDGDHSGDVPLQDWRNVKDITEKA